MTVAAGSGEAGMLAGALAVADGVDVAAGLGGAAADWLAGA